MAVEERDDARVRTSTMSTCPGCGVIVDQYPFCPECGRGLSRDAAASAFATRGPAAECPPGAQEDTLVADRVSVSVGATVLLAPTSLRVAPGEMLGIIGPSGAGKSTLLTSLAGVLRASSGTVSLGGEDIALRLTDVGYVPQFDTVHRQLTVAEALRFASELRLPETATEAERRCTVEEAIEHVGLTERADVRTGSLSGGERKRVSVALELISRPSVLFLDEPTTGLDPGLERRLMQLARAQADGGRSVVLVTHATQSLDLCDRLAVMAPGGTLAYLGTPADAPAAFAVDTLEEIYTALTDPDRALPLPPGHSEGTTVRTDGPPPPTRRLIPQTMTIARRAALLLARDRRFLMIAGLQSAGLAVLTALLFGAHVLQEGAQSGRASQCAQLLFLMVTITIWFGAISAARQIVGERGVLRRELATGVRVESYLAAKALVLGCITGVQTLVFTTVVLFLRPLSSGVEPLIIVLLLSAWSGTALGLVVSAFATTEDQATGLIPVILIPQLLFGGAIVTVSQMSPPVKALSWLAMAQWAFAGAGHAIQMNARIAADPVFSTTNRYGHGFFAHPTALTLVVLCLFIAGLTAVLFRQLQPSNGVEGAMVRGSLSWWRLVARRRMAQLNGGIAR